MHFFHNSYRAHDIKICYPQPFNDIDTKTIQAISESETELKSSAGLFCFSSDRSETWGGPITPWCWPMPFMKLVWSTVGCASAAAWLGLILLGSTSPSISMEKNLSSQEFLIKTADALDSTEAPLFNERPRDSVEIPRSEFKRWFGTPIEFIGNILPIRNCFCLGCGGRVGGAAGGATATLGATGCGCWKPCPLFPCWYCCFQTQLSWSETASSSLAQSVERLDPIPAAAN